MQTEHTCCTLNYAQIILCCLWSCMPNALQFITQLEVSFLPHTPTQSRTHPIAFSSHQCCHIFHKTELYKESMQVKEAVL